MFCVLPNYDKELDKNLKKIHIPVIVKNIDTIDKLDVDYKLSDDEYTYFLKNWFEVWNDTSGYLEFCGQGSTWKAKVEGRIETMRKELESR